MTALISAIAVAVIGGPIMWWLRRFDQRNTAQHADNGTTLTRIEDKLDRHDGKLDRLDAKLDRHIDDKRGHR